MSWVVLLAAKDESLWLGVTSLTTTHEAADWQEDAEGVHREVPIRKRLERIEASLVLIANGKMHEGISIDATFHRLNNGTARLLHRHMKCTAPY